MKRLTLLLFISLLLLSSSACQKEPTDNYRNYYEIFVHSFYDSNEDGSGDLVGIKEKLGYLKDDLGVDGVWLMPIMPSPSYHKYDVTDYYTIDPQYGTLKDFNTLTKEANQKNIKIIIDLVLNHTSTKHPWFISAVKSLGIEPCGHSVCTVPELCRAHNPYVNYYNFTQEYNGSGYYQLGMPPGWYYEAVFWDQMPDLNLDNPSLKQEILNIAQFWIDQGVSGYRLDAVMHYYGSNTSKNVAFLSWFKEELTTMKSDIYLIGEVWADSGTILSYYPSQIDSLFNFGESGPTGDVVNVIRGQSGKSFIQKLSAYQERIKDLNPQGIDAHFISNHDQARSAGFLMSDLVNQKLAANLYMLLPGNSFIYYGEEIGMFGSGRDENKRAPLLWSNQEKLGIPLPIEGTESIKAPPAGVLEQMADPESLWRHYQKLLKIKQKYPVIARGEMTPLDLGESEAFGYKIIYEGESIDVIHNFTPQPLTVTLVQSNGAKKTIIYDLSQGNNFCVLENGTLLMPAQTTCLLK